MHLKEKLRKGQILEQVKFHDISAEGTGIGRTSDNIVVFCEGAVPGDIANVKIIKVKGSYILAEISEFIHYSEYRSNSFCKHFGYCGGCKWQNLNYDAQLTFKKKFISDALTRIGNLTLPEIEEPLKSPLIQHYRNKLEFTFSNNRWIEPELFSKENKQILPALGFHKSGAYDKVLDIQECFLQDEKSNAIRNFIKTYAVQHNIPFFDIKNHQGILRTLTIRNTTLNEWMVILGVYEINEKIIFPLLDAFVEQFPFITSLLYAHLFMANESLSNGKIYLYKGRDYILEQLGHLKFKISPNSFFQTNSLQAKRMYDVTKELAGLTGNEVVYDLYCGTGTIGLYVSDKARKVIGVEYVSAAVQDANENAQLNNITNAQFFAGNMEQILNDDFVKLHSHPDVIITDPPRAGMHKNVIQQLRTILPQKIVYVSCSPPSQARDISFLSDLYEVKYVQPVDMFPHTTHIENIVLLVRK
ncbi:MAG: 23S rRNA (uracil(1939)-C(5))-methyltransferase RlmD [Bacteroidia bacterium]